MTDEKIYRASLHFYSNGTSDLVTVMTDFSDELDVGDDIPASYSQLQFLAMALRQRALPVDMDEDMAAIADDESLSDTERAGALLSRVSPADVVAAEVSE